MLDVTPGSFDSLVSDDNGDMFGMAFPSSQVIDAMPASFIPPTVPTDAFNTLTMTLGNSAPGNGVDVATIDDANNMLWLFPDVSTNGQGPVEPFQVIGYAPDAVLVSMPDPTSLTATPTPPAVIAQELQNGQMNLVAQQTEVISGDPMPAGTTLTFDGTSDALATVTSDALAQPSMTFI